MESKQPKLKTLHKYFKKYKKYYFGGFLVIVGTNALGLLAPWFLKDGIDSLKQGTDQGTLLKYALGIVLVTFGAGILRFFARRFIIWASRYVEYDLRNEFFEHLLKLSASFHQRTPTGDLIARGSNDIEAVRMMIGPAVMYLSNTVSVSIFAFTLMIIISPKLTLYSLIPLPLLSLIMWRVGQQVHKLFKKIQDHFSVISTFVQENLSGIRVIKAYRREKHQADRFADLNREYVDLNMSLARLQAAFFPAIMFLVGLIIVTVVWAGGREVIAGSITLGEFIAFMVYLGMLIWPMLAVGFVISLYQRGIASLERIDNILNAQPDVNTIPEPVKCSGSGAISFQHLSFTYPGTDRQILRDVSFRVNPGERVAVVGATGSGKTTLVSLLARKYPVAQNAVSIDGVDINEIALDDLRAMIGYVPQESYLFSDTVANNIAFSEDQSDGEKVREASILAALDREVEGFPQQYDTILGERGITLSGGQKQRATIARALLKKPPILVFDDAFSSIDTQTEELILENLDQLNFRPTMFIISHRPSTIRRADRIVVLDRGTIVESGTHDELIAKQGRYYEIIRRELLASELELLN